METYLILIACIVVALLMYVIRFAGNHNVARFRALGARLVNLIFAAIAGMIVVHEFSPRVLVATALIYAGSSIAESIFVQIMALGKKMA